MHPLINYQPRTLPKTFLSSMCQESYARLRSDMTTYVLTYSHANRESDEVKMTQRRDAGAGGHHHHQMVEVGNGDGDVHVTSLLTDPEHAAVLGEDATLDEKTLGALGYKQEFKRCGCPTTYFPYLCLPDTRSPLPCHSRAPSLLHHVPAYHTTPISSPTCH